MLEIWLIRHGQTDWNVVNRIQGWTDVPLNATGVKQAEELADRLVGMKFRALYSSTLSRAVQTAEQIAAKTNLEIIMDARLRERSYGDCEGRYQLQRDRMPVPCKDEESKQALCSRVMEALSDMTQSYASGTVLCVTHGGVIRSVLNALGKTDVPRITNASISVIGYTKKQFTPLGGSQMNTRTRPSRDERDLFLQY